MDLKILVTGSKGQLGSELRNLLEHEYPGRTIYVDVDELDITDSAAVGAYIRNGDFTHIINCAAYTAVDRAEEEKLKCSAVNIDGISNIAKAANESGAKIVHISTDYVFDGEACRPYRESDKVNPTSHYGSTKRKGETALLGLAPDAVIIRTGWLYSPYGHNFVKTILKLSASEPSLRVVSDQVGTPTYAHDLARAIINVITSKQWHPGIIHFSNEGVCSWYDLAVAVQRLSGITSCPVTPIKTEDYPTATKRPHFSVLDKSKYKVTYSKTIPHWHDSLEACLKRMKNQE